MDETAQEICIGIDLGTTNSEVAIVQNGKPIVLKVDHAKIVPSVVSIDDSGQVLVGKAAVNRELAAPSQTVRWIKRKMGRDEIIVLGNKNYTPPMISSLILLRLKQAAEEFLKAPVKKAVITVPAFFNEKQREATKEAAELAGLEPIRLLNEPTAAALAYALGSKRNECCLVYDLGGGTFDVSIVHLSDEIMEVKSSHGDVELGGQDFDTLIANKARQSFLDLHGIDLAEDPLSWIRLMRAAENAKIRLSTDASAQLIEEFIATKDGEAKHLNVHISRSEFEALVSPLLEKTITSVHKALEMAFMTKEQLTRVILVGGSTAIPLVSEILERELGIHPQSGMNPSTVVAMGAAIESARLTGQTIGPMMVDITPHSLGIECLGEEGLFNYILIRRNTPLPHTASHVFYKMHEEQEEIEIKVFQGESRQLYLNQLLGSFKLNGLLSPARDIHVKFELDRSGLLNVTATEIASGKKAHAMLKRAVRNGVQHANLADLDTVRILPEVIETVGVVEGEEEEDVVNSSEDTTAFVSLDNVQLLERVDRLLSRGDLDPVDAAELSNEQAQAKNGDKAALERISNLLYYIE